MKHFEIMVYNCGYPLVYMCTTIAEAYGCITTLAGWVPNIRIDLNEIMVILVDMQRGHQSSHDGCIYRIDIKDGEV